jgi:hypothetical protein
VSWYDWLVFWKKPAPIHELPAAEPVKETHVPLPLTDVFLEAIQETYNEQYKAEQELLNDSKLRDYIKKAIKKINKDLTGDSYSFIHVHPHDVGISGAIWDPFAKILIELCKHIDLPAENKGGHLYLEKKDVARAFGALKKTSIDIDERTRAMLSTGIYR